MIYTLKIILGEPMTTAYQAQIYLITYDEEEEIFLQTKYLSWLWISIDEVIEPGIYEIPEEDRNDLTWFYSNNFRLDSFGRRHIGYTMQDYEPISVTVI